MNHLLIDFETRSRVDLKNCGIYVYAENASTDIFCAAVKRNDEPVKLWVSDPFKRLLNGARYQLPLIDSYTLSKLVTEADEIEAHNAQFERIMWREVMHKRYGFQAIPLKKWRCSAAKAAYFALPRSLGEACEALNLTQKKDYTGYKVMMKMCKPNSKGEWNENQADFLTLLYYCMQDVEAEYALDHTLYDLPPAELEMYHLDQEINDRGITVDIESIENLKYKVQEKESRLLLNLQEATKGAVKSVRQIEVTRNWLKEKGVEVDDLTKETVKVTLAKNGIPKDVERVLQIRQSLGKSSVAKLDAMKRWGCRDNRVRGSLLYYGANTGRWAGKGIQPQNYPRESFSEETIFDVLTKGVDEVDEKYGCVIHAASKSLRGMLTAGKGKILYCADFSSIEARVLAWLAEEEKVLNAFRENLDLYKVAASDIYHVSYDEVTKDQRLIGKVCVLALGYQGWLGAFDSMADVYGVKLEADRTIGLPEAEAKVIRDEKATEIITNWRQAHPRIVSFWRGVESAALEAVKTGGQLCFGRVKYGMRGRFLHCRLPSGRLLSYCDPKPEFVKTKYGTTKEVIGFKGVNADTGKWGQLHTYGGKLTENIVQAVARDLLVASIFRLEKSGYPVNLHVHDEIISEKDEGTGDLKEFEHLTALTPDWAFGLPMGAEAWCGKRYRKG